MSPRGTGEPACPHRMPAVPGTGHLYGDRMVAAWFPEYDVPPSYTRPRRQLTRPTNQGEGPADLVVAWLS